jgi:hypothetical protein
MIMDLDSIKLNRPDAEGRIRFAQKHYSWGFRYVYPSVQGLFYSTIFQKAKVKTWIFPKLRMKGESKIASLFKSNYALG